jgi:hypothetical protein
MRHFTELERWASAAPWNELPREHAIATSALAEWLYRHYFIGWQPSERPRTDFSGSPWFVAELNARCTGTTWEHGFELVSRVGAGAFVRNENIQLWVADAGSLKPRNARPGAAVSVKVPCAREGALPGFFTIVAPAGHPASADPHLKFYVNVTPQGALALMEGLLKAPALKSARFGAKVSNDPSQFGRRDTLLVYVDPKAAPLMAEYLRGFSKKLLPETPPMTVELTRGLSIAESPPHAAESFGAHRCRLIAEALFTARREDLHVHTAVSDRFEREGLDWEAPWFGVLPRRWLASL